MEVSRSNLPSSSPRKTKRGKKSEAGNVFKAFVFEKETESEVVLEEAMSVRVWIFCFKKGNIRMVLPVGTKDKITDTIKKGDNDKNQILRVKR